MYLSVIEAWQNQLGRENRNEALSVGQLQYVQAHREESAKETDGKVSKDDDK